MARTPRIDNTTLTGGVVLLVVALFTCTSRADESSASKQQAPSQAIIVTNPYVTNSTAIPETTLPAPTKSQLVPQPTNAPQVNTNRYRDTGSNAVEISNPHVVKPLPPPAEWEPLVVENPFTPDARLSRQQQPLRWGPVSRWRTPERNETAAEHDKALAEKETDRHPLTPLSEPPSLEPTGAANSLATTPQVISRPDGPDLKHLLDVANQEVANQDVASQSATQVTSPAPNEWATTLQESNAIQSVSGEVQQPTWLKLTQTETKAIVEANTTPAIQVSPATDDRWHSPTEGPFDPFDEPTTDAVFISDDSAPTGINLASRNSTLQQTSPALADHSETGSASPRLEQAKALAQSAATLRDLKEVVRACRILLAAENVGEEADEVTQLEAWAHNRSGELLLDIAQPLRAMQEFELAIELDPTNALALHNRAIGSAQKGEHEQALRDFTAAIEHSPALLIAYRNRGELFAALGQTEAAIDDYTVALGNDADDDELLVSRALAYHRLRNFELAMNDFNAALRLQPANPLALTARGNLLAEIGNYRESIEDYRLALLADAKWGEAYRSLAWLLATCPDQRFRNPRRAMIAARQAAKFGAEDDPFVLEALAAATASAGQFDAAADLQRRAVAAAPQEVANIMNHRLALYQQGQSYVAGQSTNVMQTSHEE